MDLFTLILIALGLSADAFAVSVTNGMCSSHVSRKNAFYTALTFGLFQAAMPVLGFFLGRTFSEFVSRFQHWVALFLLGFIGINMIVDAVKEGKNPEESCGTGNVFTVKNLILQGIATSIDALAAGVGFAVMDINILWAATLIGTITFFCSFAGVYIGRKFGALLGLRARFVGGILLLIIGIRIFVEHQMLIMS